MNFTHGLIINAESTSAGPECVIMQNGMSWPSTDSPSEKPSLTPEVGGSYTHCVFSGWLLCLIFWFLLP